MYRGLGFSLDSLKTLPPGLGVRVTLRAKGPNNCILGFSIVVLQASNCLVGYLSIAYPRGLGFIEINGVRVDTFR